MNELSKALTNDAIAKQTEADVNEQYAKELENTAKNKNNKTAPAKKLDSFRIVLH